jgi:hypothetical protein
LNLAALRCDGGQIPRVCEDESAELVAAGVEGQVAERHAAARRTERREHMARTSGDDAISDAAMVRGPVGGCVEEAAVDPKLNEDSAGGGCECVGGAGCSCTGGSRSRESIEQSLTVTESGSARNQGGRLWDG